MNTEIYNGSLKRDWKSLGEDEDHPYFQQLVLNSNIEWFSYDLDTYIIAVSKYSGIDTYPFHCSFLFIHISFPSRLYCIEMEQETSLQASSRQIL